VTAFNSEERLLALASLYTKHEQLRRRVLEDGGWTPVYIDSGGRLQEVLHAALIALGLDA
jgi:hypothetical protein